MAAQPQINLFPRKSFNQTFVGRFLQWALTYGRYIIIGTEIVVLLAFVSRFKLDRDLNDLREEIEQKQAIILVNRDFENEIRSIQNHLSQISAIKTDQTFAILLLRHIETITPADVSFEFLSVSNNSMILTAKSTSAEGLTLFINNLKQSPFFADVKVNNLKQEESKPATFDLTAAIVQP